MLQRAVVSISISISMNIIIIIIISISISFRQSSTRYAPMRWMMMSSS
jgi:hypothetical protein